MYSHHAKGFLQGSLCAEMEVTTNMLTVSHWRPCVYMWFACCFDNTVSNAPGSKTGLEKSEKIASLFHPKYIKQLRSYPENLDQSCGPAEQNYHPVCTALKTYLVTDNVNKSQCNEVTEISGNADLNSLWQVWSSWSDQADAVRLMLRRCKGISYDTDVHPTAVQ